MATMNSSFKIRKSNRRSTSSVKNESHTQIIHPIDDLDQSQEQSKESRSSRKSKSVVSAIRNVFKKCDGKANDDSDSVTSAEENVRERNRTVQRTVSPYSQTFHNRMFLASSDSSPSPSDSLSSRSPVSLRSPPRTTPMSIARQFSLQRKSRITTEELTKACKRLLSPTKRKSDEENDFARCSVSPVKSPRSSSDDTSPNKSLEQGTSGSPVKLSPPNSSNTPETPRSCQREPRRLSAASRGTPRRLFTSPQKQGNNISGSTPAKLQLSESLLTPESTPSKLDNSTHRSYARPYLSAKRCLHTAKPDRLICRDSEAVEIEDFICDKVDNGESGSLYISGAPGTGKTAVVSYVIDKLKSQYGSMKAVFVNCMMLKDSSAVFSYIHMQLKGTPVKSKDATRTMEKLFTNCSDSVLLVLDEIDQLDSKHHHILYSIFEWPALKGSKLVLIGIANALDLTDRVLPRLQASKVYRPTLMNFAPYTSVQITEILKQRLERDSAVEPSAINFCARKVAAVAGDVRKALDVCRRAVEMVEADVRSEQVLKPADCNSPRKSPVKKVTLAHISKVMSEVYGSSVNAANSSENDVPLQQKLAVCSLLVLVKKGRVKEIQLGKLHEAYTQVCKRQQMGPVDQSEFHSILSLLDARGIIVMKKGKETRLVKVSLKQDEQELEHTLKDKALMATILKDGIPK